MTKVSFVIVSWNVEKLIHDLLLSIRNTSSNEFDIEIIVVDNNSSDGTVRLIKEQFPEVRLVESQTNLGFAKGNNVGFELAQGEFVFILNPDTKFETGSWHSLVRTLDQDISIGIAGPKIFYGDGSIQGSCCRKRLSVWPILWFECMGLDRLPIIGKRIQRERFFFNSPAESKDTPGISGAAMLIRRDLLRDLGGFDERYLHGGEDIDLCDKVIAAGKRIRYVAESELIHYQGKSGEQAPVRSLVNMALSNETYFLQQRGAAHATAYRWAMVFFNGYWAALRTWLVQALRLKTAEQLRPRYERAKAFRAWKKID